MATIKDIIAERLVWARTQADLSRDEVSERLGSGFSIPAIQAHENARNNVKPDVLRRYAMLYKVGVDWLSAVDVKTRRDGTIVYEEARVCLSAPTVGISERESEYGALDLGSVGVYDVQIAAGDGAYIDEAHRTGEVTFDRSWLATLTNAPPSKLRMLQLTGDSMENTLPDGSWIMIDTNDKRLINNKIYAFRDVDEARIKRISIHPVSKRISLISDNPTWPIVADVNPSELEIFGRVIWYSKKL